MGEFVLTDNQKTTLEVGQEVAYNLSGQIAKGRIKTISAKPKPNPRVSWAPLKIQIEIELLHRAAGHLVGHISKVTSEHNVLVLKQGEE